MWPSPTLRLQSLLLQNLCWPKVFHQTQANMLLSPKALLWPRPKEQNDIIPYVHDLSSPIQNKRKTMKYSTLTLQTKLQDLMHYCIRWPLLEDSLRTRPPVKIRRFTCTADQAHYQWYDRHFSTLANWVLFPVCRAVDQQVHHDSRYPPEFKRRWFSVSPW